MVARVDAAVRRARSARTAAAAVASAAATVVIEEVIVVVIDVAARLRAATAVTRAVISRATVRRPLSVATDATSQVILLRTATKRSSLVAAAKLVSSLFY